MITTKQSIYLEKDVVEHKGRGEYLTETVIWIIPYKLCVYRK